MLLSLSDEMSSLHATHSERSMMTFCANYTADIDQTLLGSSFVC